MIFEQREWSIARDDLVNSITSLGFPEELGHEIAKTLGSPKAIRRMISYLHHVRPYNVEIVVDGLWIKEVLDYYKVDKISFVVSSYSSSMFLSFAKSHPEMVDKALLLVPSGIAHGPIMPMMGKMVVPFITYFFHPTVKGLNGVIRCMGGKGDEIWRKFFNLMMSGYKMEMRLPREYKKEELKCINSPLLIIASDNDIFFPADRVFKKAREIFDCPVHFVRIKSKHLPSEKVMIKVCNKTTEFFLNE